MELRYTTVLDAPVPSPTAKPRVYETPELAEMAISGFIGAIAEAVSGLGLSGVILQVAAICATETAGCDEMVSRSYVEISPIGSTAGLLHRLSIETCVAINRKRTILELARIEMEGLPASMQEAIKQAEENHDG